MKPFPAAITPSRGPSAAPRRRLTPADFLLVEQPSVPDVSLPTPGTPRSAGAACPTERTIWGDRFAAWCVWIFGPVEFTSGWLCDDCQDVHEDGECCPRAMTATCVQCDDVVRVSRYGNCVVCGSQSVVDRRLVRGWFVDK